MLQSKTHLTVTEFLNQPETDITYELVNGEAIPKMSPKRFHSRLTGALYTLLTQWCQEQGEVGIEWAVTLTRTEQDWVPVPDLLYISYTRLSRDRVLDEACPIPPELVIEIISPGQSFGDLAEKAVDYLQAGVLRVWVVDSHASTITVFYPDAPPQTKRGDAMLTDTLLAGLQLTPQNIFQQAGLPD
ncbi:MULTISPECIES: Uma2 family endonuclease [unclassified Coleofasciculus]|uniref:Uma2 family endonuclease n=1 Tax=unclassified Coleofasciculus TaxID=2692782 RepID=UPI0018816907|nr:MULTISPECIES: Uma2 family endonuclease [unclassified Coleofasciculus]MBE9125496.1 Uma2 family endonuclease [Coleofasciculus sp. LEGE 07081]MBE9148640.1 Uma2 family endonuclease [Coleofasciculus sp. LEGE 07092]